MIFPLLVSWRKQFVNNTCLVTHSIATPPPKKKKEKKGKKEEEEKEMGLSALVHKYERHVWLGEDRGKSSAAHARAPPIDPPDRQTDRQTDCIPQDGNVNYLSVALLQWIPVWNIWSWMHSEEDIKGMSWVWEEMIYKAASPWSNIIEMLYKSIKNKFASRTGRRRVFYY